MNTNENIILDIKFSSAFIVTPLSRLNSVIKHHNPSHIITLLSPNAKILPNKAISPENHHILFFNDINEPRPNLTPPQMKDVEAIIQAAKYWYISQNNCDKKTPKPLLIHCQMGISRSTAAAYICSCALNNKLNEESLAITLRQLSPSATPNARLIALADEYLNRKGRMINAIKRIGRGADAHEGLPFILPVNIDSSYS